MRLGVIGTGAISQSVHLPSIRRAGLDLAMVCDLSPSRAAQVGRELGVAATTDPAEVIASDAVDAVLVATPGSHARLAADAIRAGKHVLAEKPVALTVAEVDELRSLADEHGVVVQVRYMKMYDPLTETAREQCAELRDTRLIQITVAHPADHPQVAHLRMMQAADDADQDVIDEAVAYESAQAARALPGASPELLSYYTNVLNGSVVHELSLMRALELPLPTQWQASVYPSLADSPPCLLAHARVGDAQLVLSWNWLPDHPEYHEELSVLASNGRLEYSLAKPYVLEARSHLRVQRHRGLQRQDVSYVDGFETGFLRQLDAFAASVKEGAPVLSDLAGAREDIIQLQLLAQAVAADLGTPIAREGDA